MGEDGRNEGAVYLIGAIIRGQITESGKLLTTSNCGGFATPHY